MTKITIDRSTVEQALEAQKALLSLVEDPCPYDAATTRAAARASITALKAALAEPVQEPVGEMMLSVIFDGMVVPVVPADLPVGTKLYAAPPQPPAEPVQEQQCNPHPEAPHGFLRNASHTEGRYVCACEFWTAPVQEPVAWSYGALLYHDKLDALEFMRTSNDGYQLEPLYTAPPQRKPLTEEEIVRIFETPELAGARFQTSTLKAIAVARAVEAAHGIKEGT